MIKKNAVDLTDLAVGIVVLGIVVSIGATILVNVRDSRLTDLGTVLNGNETQTFSNSGVSLTNVWVKSVDVVANATGGEIISSGNYSLSVNSATGIGTLSPTGASQYNGTSINVTYTTYNISEVQWSTANNASIGLAEYGNWFTIIVIVGIAAVILGLIFLAFGRSSTSSIGGSY